MPAGVFIDIKMKQNKKTVRILLTQMITKCNPLRKQEEVRMKKAILATKVGMTQIFNEDGVLTPVTVFKLVHV